MKKIMLLLVFAFLGIGCMWAQSLPFKDAGSRLGRILQVEVTGSNSVPVIFKRGTHQIFTVKFSVNQDILNYRFKAYAIFDGTPVPVPGAQPIGLTTPFKAGSDHSYLLRIDTQQTAPKITFIMRFILESDKGEVIVAFDIQVKVK